MTSFSRRYRFCASHRLHCITLSDQDNARIYGKCNNPYGHGHDYTLAVTATGPVDPVAGVLFPVSHLDRLVEDHILARFDHRNLNADLEEFAELVPTTENIALVIAGLLQKNWNEYIYPPSSRLSRIFIEETDRNSFEVLVPVAGAVSEEARSSQGRVTVNA